MIRSEIRTRSYANGEIQRVQIVRADGWETFRFFRGAPDPGALAAYARIYRNYLVPSKPWAFGRMVLYPLPEGTETAAECRRNGLHPETDGRAETVRGKLPFTRYIPVRPDAFLLSGSADAARLLVNASFFIFDPFDCSTRYDALGTPFGLTVADGEVSRPPLFGREALIVRKDGRVSVETPSLEQLGISIGGKEYRVGENATAFTRPSRRRTPVGRGFDHVIAGRRLLDVVRGGSCPVPSCGFVLRLPERAGEPGDPVRYTGMEDVRFAVQAGNSLMKGGVRTDRFISTFYDIRRPWKTTYPPCLYPLGYETSRAARIAIGADGKGDPMILWAEGAAKIGYRPGEGSCGTSLSEFALICEEAGMVNGVNLDGGGSAQILLDGVRHLRISDRDETEAETERFIPLAIAAG